MRIQVNNLTTYYCEENRKTALIEGLNFTINPSQTLALVGESGSGKSITAFTIARLLARNCKWQIDGAINFIPNDKNLDKSPIDLLKLNTHEFNKLRGTEIAMIFQEPMNCLNPLMTISNQIAESVIQQWGYSHEKARTRALEMLDLVEIPQAKNRLDDYPHQFSGGMRQRVMIALAMACHPSFLIADEPTTALDVTIQAQILNLIAKIKTEFQMAVLFITHNLGVVAQYAESVAVMYAGRIIEYGDVHDIFKNPRHRYTNALLQSLPSKQIGMKKLQTIEGIAATPFARGSGCAFAPRCAHQSSQCTQIPNDIFENNHLFACWNPIEANHG